MYCEVTCEYRLLELFNYVSENLAIWYFKYTNLLNFRYLFHSNSIYFDSFFSILGKHKNQLLPFTLLIADPKSVDLISSTLNFNEV